MTSSLLRAFLVLSTIAAAGSAVADDTWRCGSKLVEIGMTRTEVLQYCGAPTVQAIEEIPVRNNSQVGGKTTKYRWTYKSYSATRVFVFDQDKLMSIQWGEFQFLAWYLDRHVPRPDGTPLGRGDAYRLAGVHALVMVVVTVVAYAVISART